MRIYISILLFLLCTPIWSQKVIQPKQIDLDLKGVIFKEEFSFEGKIHTNGLAIGLNFGKLQTYYKTKYYRIELGFLKDPSERRQNRNIPFPNVGTSSGFVYGKQNSLYVLRGTRGIKRYLSEKTKRKGVAVGITYEGGISLGLLKPYFLEILPDDQDLSNQLRTISHSEENEELFLDYSQIFGGSSFFKGITGTDLAVGIHGKVSSHFAFGAFDKNVKAVEIGAMVDIFAQKMPILVEREGVSNNRIFLNFFISFQIGKRKKS